MNQLCKKGISLVALVITVVVLIIITGTVIISTMNNGIIEETQSTVNLTNKKEILEDIQAKIQIKKAKKGVFSIYQLEQNEIIKILQEYGTFNNSTLILETQKAGSIYLYEIMEIPLEEYATITYENSILTIQTELTDNGYRIQYTTDAGNSWNLYTQAVTVSEES